MMDIDIEHNIHIPYPEWKPWIVKAFPAEWCRASNSNCDWSQARNRVPKCCHPMNIESFDTRKAPGQRICQTISHDDSQWTSLLYTVMVDQLLWPIIKKASSMAFSLPHIDPSRYWTHGHGMGLVRNDLPIVSMLRHSGFRVSRNNKPYNEDTKLMQQVSHCFCMVPSGRLSPFCQPLRPFQGRFSWCLWKGKENP